MGAGPLSCGPGCLPQEDEPPEEDPEEDPDDDEPEDPDEDPEPPEARESVR